LKQISRSERGKHLFEKKKQKTFGQPFRAQAAEVCDDLVEKVFLLLFVNKKKTSPLRLNLSI